MSEPVPPTNPTSTLARIAVRSTLWVSIGTYLNQTIGFVSVLIMTRLLTPEIFGYFSLGTFWNTLLNLRSKAALNYAAIRQPESDGQLMGTYLVLDAVAALGSLVLSIIVALILNQVGTAPEVVLVLIVLTVADGITVIVSPLSMVLEKELQVSRLTLMTLLAATAAYVIAIALALAGVGVWSLLAVNIVTNGLSLFGVYRVCRQRWPQAFQWHWQFDRALAKHLLRDGLPTGLSLTALGTIVTQFDNFLIGTFVGYATLGYYDRAYRIAHWPNLLLTIIVTRIGFLTFSKVQNDRPRLTHAVRLSFWILTTLGIPIGLLLLFGAPDIVQIIYGPKWSESAFFLRFLTVYSFLWPLANVGFWLSVAKGHRRTMVFITMAQAATLVILGTPLTLQWGSLGTIFAVIVTMILAFSLSSHYVFRQVDLSFLGTFGAPAVALGGATLVLALAMQFTGLNELRPLLRLITIGLLGPGVFWLILFLLHPAETIERVQYLRRVWHKP